MHHGSGTGRRGRLRRRTLRRRLGLERSVLRRRIDRAQRLVALGLLLLFLLSAPPVGLWTWHVAYDSGTRAERIERITRHQVTATVTAADGFGSAGDRYVHETVQVAWPGPDGKPRSGSLPAWKDAKVGAKTRIWADRDGRLSVRPRPHSRTVTDAAYAGGAAAVAAGLPLLLAYLLLRHRCDRRRDAMWDAAWERMDTDADHNRPS
ncbi:Rv1733c family protein [Actinomadura hibisca]|uniref:Rv1733c family protein n=1 Tax=Actinomadura hibisca TaxID=68565 RepID=UPI000833A86B|nr:hypothetical protein [Actinomadura hibisca]